MSAQRNTQTTSNTNIKAAAFKTLLSILRHNLGGGTIIKQKSWTDTLIRI
jgi:hypothetical protein